MLTPRKRLTKKELKEDKLVTFYFNAQDWVENNSKILFIGIGAIVVVLLLSFYVISSKQKAESSASVELAIAMRSISSNDYESAKPVLQNIISSYGSTQSGKLAKYYLGNALFQTGDYEQAEKHFSDFAKGFKGDDYVKASAMAAVAACHEQLKDYEKAAQQYVKTANKFPESFTASENLLKAANCYSLAGNPQKAAELYDTIVHDYPDSEEKDEALLLKSVM